MSLVRKFVSSAIALCVGALGAMPFATQAQDTADSWQWRASIYGWFPAIDGKTRFPSGGSGPSIEVDASEILDALKFTLMGTLQARKGHWGVFTDLIYLDVGDDKPGTRSFTVGQAGVPADVSLNANFDLKTWVWTLAGIYAVSDTSHNTTDVLFGTRMVDITQKLDWSFNGNIGSLGLPGRSGSGEVDATNWDAIIGLKGVAILSGDRRWVLPYYVDVGAGESSFTWQAMAGIGYSFNWGTTVLAWRYLDYEFKSDAPIDNIDFSGPFLGVTFQW
jgi:hypothetical protein